MKYFINYPYTAESLKAEFRALCLTMHPDKGGNADEFKTMSAEYEQTARNLNGTKQNRKAAEDMSEAMRRAAEKMRQQEEERREAERQAEEARRRREQEEREEAERIRKAQEESRAAVRAWAAILERIPEAVSGKKRAYDFADKKACAAYIAATKRNIKAVINHYFPGLDVKVTISGEIWKEKFSIAWQDGPTADELRETCKELEFFVPSYYASDPYADYGSYYSRKESEPWREAYGGGLGDATDYDTARTLSEEGEEQAANIAAGIFADFDPAKLHKSNEQFKMTLTEWHKFAELCKIKGVVSHFENLIRCYSGNNEGMAYYSSIRRYLRDYVKVSVTKKEKAPEFKPTYGPTLKAIKKALGGNVFATMQETKRRENDWTPCDFSVLLGDLQGVNLCKPYCYDMETYYSPVYFTSYKTESTRRQKFEAVGITMSGASVKAVREDVKEAMREELADIERQRQEWEKEQAQPKGEKATKKPATAAENADVQTTPTPPNLGGETNGEGLRMEQYSEKATVIRGYNAEQAAELEAMGGKEWRNLRGGKGYIFSTRRHGEKLAEWFARYTDGEKSETAENADVQTTPTDADVQTTQTPPDSGVEEDTNKPQATAEGPRHLVNVDVLTNDFGTVRVGERVTDGRHVGKFLCYVRKDTRDPGTLIIIGDDLQVHEADPLKVRRADGTPTESHQDSEAANTATDTANEPQQPRNESQNRTSSESNAESISGAAESRERKATANDEKRDSGTRIRFSPEDCPDFEEAA